MRGIGLFKLFFRHAKTRLLIVTAVGIHLGELVGAAMAVENVFAYPGVSRYAVEAIINNDYPVIQCFIFAYGIDFCH